LSGSRPSSWATSRWPQKSAAKRRAAVAAGEEVGACASGEHDLGEVAVVGIAGLVQLRPAASFDTPGALEYVGGVSAANARRIVLRCSPVRVLISRIDSRSTRCMRLISAHCSTPTTPSSSPDR
jgi:hypothetical protein